MPKLTITLWTKPKTKITNPVLITEENDESILYLHGDMRFWVDKEAKNTAIQLWKQDHFEDITILDCMMTPKSCIFYATSRAFW